jgi:hypothetical protein
MDGGNIASILAAVVAALSAWAVSRSASKGAQKAQEIEAQTARESARSSAESEAYERARAFDTETIARQGTQIQELQRALGERESELGQVRTDNGLLHADIRLVSTENRELQAEIAECHRVIENLRSYIRHNPLGGNLPPELEAGPETPAREIDPMVRERVIEAIGEDPEDYTETGDSYPDQM